MANTSDDQQQRSRVITCDEVKRTQAEIHEILQAILESLAQTLMFRLGKHAVYTYSESVSCELHRCRWEITFLAESWAVPLSTTVPLYYYFKGTRHTLPLNV